MPRLVEVVNRVHGLELVEEDFAAIVHRLDELGDWTVPDGDLSVALIDEEECGQLHGDFFDDPSVTDVMTFPGEEEDYAGDIAICLPFAAEEAPQHGFTLRQEVTLYLVHGWLHLAGLRDDTPENTQAMRAAEARCLEVIGQEQLWPELRWNS
ncbi:MAG: rRNA maturation RNase YbeY [Verrucomicrobiota bacterium JB022]|nr:rRNA maturation RNase YbeY [Verrucomicrobiota bacterium JB022]